MDLWCQNLLQVYGSKEAKQSFKVKAKGKFTAISLIELHNMPEDVHEGEWLPKHFDLPDDLDAHLHETQFSLVYQFYTNNSPPFKWLKLMSTEFPALWFELDYLIEDPESEEGYFYRKAQIQRGEIKSVAKFSIFYPSWKFG